MSHRTLIFVLLTALGAFSAEAAEPRFRPAPGAEPVIGRYLVTLESSVPLDAAEALARSYDGKLDRQPSSEDHTFAITILPARARSLSADPRVTLVAEVSQQDERRTPSSAPSASLASHLLTPHSLSSSGLYTYDGAGNIKSIGSDSFLYDDAGRLVDATVHSYQQTYTYDIYGNRLSATRGNNAIGCMGGTNCEAPVTVTPSTNHLAGVTYDDAGNVTDGYGAHYNYDGTGMITKLTVGTDLRNFAYTADDERIAVKQGASWTWTVRDQGGKVLRELTSTETVPFALTGHAWSKDYVWRDGLLLASLSGSPATTYHYHLDHLGTPRMITRDAGVIVSTHSYYPFGAEMNLSAQENPTEAMKFTGHERDTIAGDNASVDYMHARYYNGNLGRFLSVDRARNWSKAMSNPQAWDRYAYTRNNPLRLLDPDGKDDKDFRILTVHINVIYSNADVKINGGQSLRQVTEQGIAHSRSFYADAGIKLDVHRFEGTINTQTWGNINGPVKTSTGDVTLSDFTKSQKGSLNVLVSGDLGGVTGKTVGVGGPTMIGTGSDKMVFNDEISHALGNVTAINIPLVSNALADIRLDVQETFVEHGWGMSQWYRDTFRDTLDKINGDPRQ